MYEVRNGTLCAEFKKRITDIFGEGANFKLDAHRNQNWTLWNMFLDCGTTTVCIIDLEEAHDFDIDETALDNLMEKYDLTMGYIDERYVYIKYAVTPRCENCGDTINKDKDTFHKEVEVWVCMGCENARA